MIQEAIRLLQSGGLVAFPTETVYGLGALMESKEAVARLFGVKRRPTTKPLLAHIYDLSQVEFLLEEPPPLFWELAVAFWPGPLTLIARKKSHVPDAVTCGRGSLGLRFPAHPVALELLRGVGQCVVASSANRSGEASPATAQEIPAGLADLVLGSEGKILGVSSTVVSLEDPARPVVLREGPISSQQLRCFFS